MHQMTYEYQKDRIGRVAFIDLVGKRVAAKICPSLFGILGQGGSKDDF
jgi:hypothetical protein